MAARILLAATSCWVVTARLADALVGAGCNVEVVCPPGHPVRRTRAVSRVYRYRFLAPLRSVDLAIRAALPDLIIPCDDLARAHMMRLHARVTRAGDSGATRRALLEDSLGEPSSIAVATRRSDLMAEVTVIGAGASAIDLAVLLTDIGARVVLVARRPALRFNDPPLARRSAWTKLRRPSSTIGPGWRSVFCTKAPGLFYRLPGPMRRRIFETFAPSAGWPMKERFTGRVTVLLGQHLEKAEIRQERVWLLLSGRGGWTEHVADHVIAATGYRVDMRRLTFLDEAILSGMRMIDHAPLLSPYFETSIPGLYVVGVASKYDFGPVMQFACGAPWTEAKIARRLSRSRRPSRCLSYDEARRRGGRRWW